MSQSDLQIVGFLALKNTTKRAETFTFHPAFSAWSTIMVAIPVLSYFIPLFHNGAEEPL